MKRIIILVCMLIALIAIPASAQNVIDVKGWNVTIWGMTENELNDLFPNKIIKFNKREYLDKNKIYRDFGLQDFEIDGNELPRSKLRGIKSTYKE